MSDSPGRRRQGFRILLGGAVAAVGVLVWVLYFPIMRSPISHQPPPAPDHDQAAAGVRALIAATPPEVRSTARPVLLDHGYPTKRVFVLLHGLSNNPAQFAKLGQQLFERGHNVVIARLPFHGEENLLTTSWGRLTARQMVESGNEAADLARGLGQEVVVAGLSVNGTVAAWMAQNRADLSRVVVMAPFLAPAGVPGWAVGPLERLLLRLPNIFVWWNPVLKEKNPGPPTAYPRFPTRVIGETMWLGQTVLHESRHKVPACPSIVVVTTAADLAANNGLTAELVANWRKMRPSGIKTWEFPVTDEVPHDFVDPAQTNEKTERVYPVLLELLEN